MMKYLLDKMNVPRFHRFKPKNQLENAKSNKVPKGIAVFVIEGIKDYSSLVNMDNEDAIWVKIKIGKIG